MKIIVLGSGLVGAPMAVDLAKDPRFEVSIADINEAALKKIADAHPIQTVCKDLSSPGTVGDVVKDSQGCLFNI